MSLVTAPLASKDRQMNAGSEQQPSDPAHCRSVSPIIEVQEDADSSSSTDDENQLTATSNADWSPTVVDFSAAVEFQTISEGPTLHSPSASGTAETEPEAVVRNNEIIIEIGETDDNRDSSQSADIVDKLEAKRGPLFGDVDRNMTECSDSEHVTLEMPSSVRETNSDEQVLDDVIVVIDNDANGDVVGNFFTPSIVDPFAFSTVSPPPRDLEPIRGLNVCKTESPGIQVQETSAVVVDGAYKRLEGGSTTVPLVKNGADSSAVGWPPSNRFGLATSPRAESSAPTASTSVWRRNPLTRLVRYRKDMVRQTFVNLLIHYC